MDHRELLAHLERRKHYTSICNAGPSEAMATIALRNAEALKGRTKATLAENLLLFEAFFAEWEGLFEWEPPAGGCVCFPRYLGDEGVQTFCRGLREEAGVVLLPAGIFASPLADVPADRFRIGLGRHDPEPALAAFDGFLRLR